MKNLIVGEHWHQFQGETVLAFFNGTERIDINTCDTEHVIREEISGSASSRDYQSVFAYKYANNLTPAYCIDKYSTYFQLGFVKFTKTIIIPEKNIELEKYLTDLFSSIYNVDKQLSDKKNIVWELTDLTFEYDSDFLSISDNEFVKSLKEYGLDEYGINLLNKFKIDSTLFHSN